MIPLNEGGTCNRRGQHVDFMLPPLNDAAGTMGVGRRGTIGAILSPIVDKNSMGPPVVATLIHENPGIPQVTS